MPGFMAPTLTNANGSLTLLPSNQTPPGSQSYLPTATGPTMQNKNSATHDNLTAKFKDNLLTKKVSTLRSTAAAALTAQKKVNKIFILKQCHKCHQNTSFLLQRPTELLLLRTHHLFM